MKGNDMQTTIKNRKYRVEKMEGNYPRQKQDLIDKGFDGETYLLHGIRGALKMAFKTTDGKFEIVGR